MDRQGGGSQGPGADVEVAHPRPERVRPGSVTLLRPRRRRAHPRNNGRRRSAMATYKELFMNGLNKIISDLVNSSQPTQAPGAKAWTWFTAASGASPDDVNTYVAAKITGATATETVFTPNKNWARWSTAMQGNLAFAPN